MNQIESLKLAGLSEKEAITYLDLLKHGESKTGKICQRTSIPSSYIYTVLTDLLEKGLVSYKIINNIKIFYAAEPDALTRVFEEKEKKIREEKREVLSSISKLKTLPKKLDRLTDFKYYKGIRGIKSLYTEIMNAWNQGDEYYIASAPLESFEKLEGFFKQTVHKKRVKDKVKLKIIINKQGTKWGSTRKKMPLTQVRYLNIDTKTEYGVLNEYFFLISYDKEPYGLLIKDENFANTYKIFFDTLWQKAQIDPVKK